MSEAARTAEQMRRMMSGGAWHGPAVLESLAGLTSASAAAYPIAGAHSIWELVVHIDKVQQHVLARLRGENPQMTEADFFPSVTDTSEPAWNAALARLKSQEEQLIALAAAMTDAQLAATVAGGSTVYETLHGHIQHNAFHAGQIRILRKALGV